jgi:hypothetical protein
MSCLLFGLFKRLLAISIGLTMTWLRKFWIYIGTVTLCYLCYLCLLAIVLSNAYYFVFLFWLSSSCVPYDCSFTRFCIFDCHSVFADVYIVMTGTVMFYVALLYPYFRGSLTKILLFSFSTFIDYYYLFPFHNKLF